MKWSQIRITCNTVGSRFRARMQKALRVRKRLLAVFA